MAHEWQGTFQELGTLLSNVTFIVIDLETSGGAPHLGAGITEIGAVKIRGGVEIERFHHLINPGHPIPSYISDLTGITDELVFNAPYIHEVMADFVDFLGDSSHVLVAQNAPFDLSFITALFREHQLTWPRYRVIDTAVIARRVLSKEEAPNCKLATLAQVFQVSIQPNHRALDDALATVDVLHGLFERLAGYKVFTIEEVLNFSKLSPAKVRPS